MRSLEVQAKAGYVAKYSMEKISSNVVEKIILQSPLKLRNDLIAELVSTPGFVGIIENSFGNFVIQKILNSKITDGERIILNNAINSSIIEIKEDKIRRKWIMLSENSSKQLDICRHQ